MISWRVSFRGERSMEDKWTRSRQMLARASQSLAGGVSSRFRAMAPVPLYFEDGLGCRLRDVDGNEYVDYALAWGTCAAPTFVYPFGVHPEAAGPGTPRNSSRHVRRRGTAMAAESAFCAEQRSQASLPTLQTPRQSHWIVRPSAAAPPSPRGKARHASFGVTRRPCGPHTPKLVSS